MARHEASELGQCHLQVSLLGGRHVGLATAGEYGFGGLEGLGLGWWCW